MAQSQFVRLSFAALLIPTVFGQLQDNREKQMTCEDRGSWPTRPHQCEVREQTLSSVGQLTVDPVRNGGVSVKGWARADVLVRSRVEAWADSSSEASAILPQVHVDSAAGKVSSTGPERHDNTGWSVSYEIFVPQQQDLKVTATNGGIHVQDVRGRVDLDTKNGGIHLARVEGDITGKTQNGGVHVTLASTWQGRQLNLETVNGGISVSAPSNLQAHIQAETVNGAIRSDFGTIAGAAATRSRTRTLDVTLGGGGATVKLTTRNGGIRIGRLERVV